MTDLIDTHLGQYQLAEIIGRGGMAVVYKAYQPSLDRFVAIGTHFIWHMLNGLVLALYLEAAIRYGGRKPLKPA